MGWFDPGFWSHYFRRVFIREIRVFERAFISRVLPAFDGLEDEADALADEEYARLGSLPGDENVDMGDLADDAQDVGLSHYLEQTAARQGMLNLATAALYHLVEQQLLLFHRRQVLSPDEEYDTSLFRWQVIHERFEATGVTLRNLAAWPAFHELECVANAVKHGDGRAAEELRKIRPDILVPEILRGDTRLGFPTPYVMTPLAGESVHVTPEDFVRYASIAVAFWEDVAQAITPGS